MTTTRHIIRLAIIIFVLTACKNSTQTNKEQTASILDSSRNLTLSEKANLNDTNYIAKILRTGIFHSNEVEENAERKKWFGLFKDNGNYYLAETPIKTSRVYDTAVDKNKYEKTGWEVKASSKQTPLFLIGGLNFLNDHKIQKANIHEYFRTYTLYPGDSLQFKFLGVDYRIYATDEKKKVNYKLYLTANKNGKTISDMFLETSQSEPATLTFSGDIDGDGFLDLILGNSSPYNEKFINTTTIYLSKPAETEHLIRAVGKYSYDGC